MLTNKLSAARRVYTAVMRVLLLLAAVLTAALVVFMIVYVLYKGLPYVTWHLISTKPSYITGAIGILPDICNTMQILLASLLIVLPLGVGAAVYLTEYAQNKKLVAAIEYAAETLSGIPSIIYGLVGMLFFCEFLGMQTSLLAGALTLVIMNLPTVLRTTQESLRTVPQSYREGAFGLGAGKWRVVRTVVLPGCIDGIVTVLHPLRWPYSGRIRRTFVHGRLCPHAEQIRHRACQPRRDADGRAVRLREGGGRI